MNKQWKHDIEAKRDLARTFLIKGGDQMADSSDETETGVVTVIESSTLLRDQADLVPPVMATKMVAFTTQLDIAEDFTLHDQQRFAFMIITGHLNGDTRFHTGTSQYSAQLIKNSNSYRS